MSCYDAHCCRLLSPQFVGTLVGSRRGSAIAGPRCCPRDPWAMSNLAICLLPGKEWRHRGCHNRSFQNSRGEHSPVMLELFAGFPWISHVF